MRQPDVGAISLTTGIAPATPDIASPTAVEKRDVSAMPPMPAISVPRKAARPSGMPRSESTPSRYRAGAGRYGSGPPCSPSCSLHRACSGLGYRGWSMDLQLVTSGQSHGPGIVAILSGMPAGLRVDRERMQRDLARRQAG